VRMHGPHCAVLIALPAQPLRRQMQCGKQLPMSWRPITGSHSGRAPGALCACPQHTQSRIPVDSVAWQHPMADTLMHT
jgi:hypothetical protein